MVSLVLGLGVEVVVVVSPCLGIYSLGFWGAKLRLPNAFVVAFSGFWTVMVARTACSVIELYMVMVI